MAKTYLIVYKSKEGKSLEEVKVRAATLGTLNPLVTTSKAFIALLRVSSEEQNGNSIKNVLALGINPFSDGIFVTNINETDFSCVGDFNEISTLEKDAQEAYSPKRNHERFKTKHEAYMAYKMEKPTWSYEYGTGVTFEVEFGEWCWLPYKKDGIYEHSKYQKYLR